MASQTTEQQNALKDAMARAKQIAAKLSQQAPNGDNTDEGRKRGFGDDVDPAPAVKRSLMDGVDHTDPKVIAQQVANSLVQRANMGPMLVEEVQVPNKLVGLVIGRGGEMINKLQSESGAKVQVAPDPPPGMPQDDRQITITGTTDAVTKAKALIAEIQSAGKIPERLLAGTMAGEFQIEMTVSSTKVGLIIGKGGETIKSLQERAGCKMVLMQDGEYAHTPEKPLRISGDQGAVMYGKQLVQDLLTSKELEGANPNRDNPEDGTYKELEVPRASVGLIIGAKGANIHAIQTETGCRIRFKNEMEGPYKIAMLSGSPEQVAIAEAKLQEIIESGVSGGGGGGGPRPHFNGPSGPNWGGPSHGGPYGGPPGPHGHGGPHGPPGPSGPQQWGRPQGRYNNNRNLKPGQKDMVIEVPANRCGLVIGKGGETIKSIKSETEVQIQLNRDVPDTSSFRLFSVQGTDEQIEKALTIIREKINDQSIVARPADESGPPQNQWGPPQQQQGWGGPPQQQQWGGPQQWGGQQQHPGGWGAPQQQQGWGQQANMQQGWNQQQQWDPQQQQWQQHQNGGGQGQWGSQQQTAQTATSQAADPNATAAAGAQAGAQPDYTAAWAAYYQQQQQYYQQYAMQQQQAAAADPTAAAAASSAATSSTAAAQTTAATTDQAQAMADYQAKLAEYYKQYGQQVPQQ